MFSNRKMHYMFFLCLTVFIDEQLMGSDEGSSHQGHFSASALSKKEQEELEELLTRGNEFYKQENYLQAISEYTNAIKKSSDVVFYRNRAKCYLRLGNIDAAIHELRIIIATKPQSREDRITLAALLFKNQKWDEAINESEGVEEYSSSNFERNIDNLFPRKGKEVPQREKGTTDFKVHTEMIAANSHNYLADLARAFLATKMWDQALHCINEAIARNPNEIHYYRYRAQCWTQMHEYELAISDYKKVLLVDFLNDAPDRESLVNILFRVNKFEEARNEIIKLGVHTTKFQNMVQQFLSSGKFDEALRCYNEAIIQDPQSSTFHEKRGEILMSNKQMPKEALADFRKACSLNSNIVSHRVNLIKALLELGKTNEAVKEMLDMTDENLYELAYHFFSKGKYNNAICCCTEAIKKSPRKEMYYELRGICYKRLSDTKSAVEDFRKSFQINPDERGVFTLINFSELLFEIREYDEARIVLGKISESELSEDDAIKVNNINQKIMEINKSRSQKSSVEQGKLSESGTSSTLGRETSTRDEDMEGPQTTNTDHKTTEAAAEGASQPPEVGELQKHKRKYASHEDMNNPQPSQDKFEMMAKAWANNLRGIVDDPQEISFAQKAIDDVLLEAQSRALKKRSVDINPTPP